MKLTVIIPTRERNYYLEYALRTCVEQDYDNLEIIVSDNFSQDATKEVVHSFQDNRIRYLNTGKRLSMSRNWEFALSHVDDGYVIFIGDDDGLLPGSISNAAMLIRDTGAKALNWPRVNYGWPCRAFNPNMITIPTKTSLVRCPARQVMRHMVRGWVDWLFGPSVYHGLVQHAVIRKIKAKTGDFFRSVTPDAYTSFAVLSGLDWYLHSTRPFSIGGESSRSTGCGYQVSSYSDKLSAAASAFMQEVDMPIHPQMDLIPGNLSSGVAEALLQVNDACYDGRLGIRLEQLIERIVSETAGKAPEDYAEGMRHVQRLCSRLGLSNALVKVTRRYPNRPTAPNRRLMGMDRFGILTLDAASLGVQNVYDCSVLTGNLIGVEYERPLRIITYGLFARALTSLHYRILSSFQLS